MSETVTYWSRHEIKDAISRWVDEFGQLPKSDEWKSGGDWWPNTSIVRRRFGTWNKAVKAAGFEPRPSASGYVGGSVPTVRLAFGIDLPVDLYERFTIKREAERLTLRRACYEAIAAWVKQ